MWIENKAWLLKNLKYKENIQYILYLVRTVSVFQPFAFFFNPSENACNIFQTFLRMSITKNLRRVILEFHKTRTKKEPITGRSHFTIWWAVDFTNTHHVIAGKFFCRTAWYIQMQYMDTIRAVHCNLNVPYLCPQYVSFTSSANQFSSVLFGLRYFGLFILPVKFMQNR